MTAGAATCATKKKRKEQPLRLLVQLERYEPHFSFGVRWNRKLPDPWSESLSVDMEGTVIRPAKLPKVYRPEVELRIYPDRQLDRNWKEPLTQLGAYSVYPEWLSCSAFVPFDTFTALVAMGPMAFLSIELGYPERRLGSVLSFALNREADPEEGE